MGEQRSFLEMSRKISIPVSTTFQYLQIFNGLLELTDKELEILSKFVDLSTTVNLCSAENKRAVAESLGMADPNTLNNYVKRLKDKNAIQKTKNGYRLSPLLKIDSKVNLEIIFNAE